LSFNNTLLANDVEIPRSFFSYFLIFMKYYCSRYIINLSGLLAVFATTIVKAATPITSIDFAIEPKFDAAENFSEGLARVGFGEKKQKPDRDGSININSYGYIDNTGKLIIPAKFSAASNFSEGLAAVKINPQTDNKPAFYGYIDKTGKMIIAPKFTQAGKFSNGLAPVFTESSQGYIDRTGKMVLKLKYQFLGDFSEGLARVGIETKSSAYEQQRYGYINSRGQLVIPFKFRSASDFSEGLAMAELSGNGHRGYINKLGQFTIKKSQLDTYLPGKFHEGLAAVELSSGACSAAAYCEYRYIDRQGKVIFPSHFIFAGDFSSGLAPVATGGGGRDAGGFFPATNWGFINKQGKLVIDANFDDAGSFSEGLAKVRIGGKYGYIRVNLGVNYPVQK
jgi:hypothetical protein